MQTDTRREFVESALRMWGVAFPLEQADREPNGTNVIYRLMHGDLPGNAGIPWQAIRIEDVVRAIHKRNPVMAAALRGYYCGRGRRSVERFQDFRRLVKQQIAKRAYFELVETGCMEVQYELFAAAAVNAKRMAGGLLHP